MPTPFSLQRFTSQIKASSTDVGCTNIHVTQGINNPYYYGDYITFTKRLA
jgi:hypothetical protein